MTDMTPNMNTSPEDLLIGFVGQGYVGGNCADDFEKRGFRTVRYSLEETYRNNKGSIGDCDIVFICTPTPTTPNGFDSSAVEEGVRLVADGKIAVIKSTVLPGTTKRIQAIFPNKTVLFSPEFLSVVTAAHDAAHPFSVVVGTAAEDAIHSSAAELVVNVLPEAPYKKICDSTEAEFIKYAHNIHGCVEILFANMLYDLAQKNGADWDPILEGIKADPFMSGMYFQPVHKTGRGAGGGCFIKDLAAFRNFYEQQLPEDKAANDMLRSLEQKNIDLLRSTGKDLDLLKGVYEDSVLEHI